MAQADEYLEEIDLEPAETWVNPAVRRPPAPDQYSAEARYGLQFRVLSQMKIGPMPFIRFAKMAREAGYSRGYSQLYCHADPLLEWFGPHGKGFPDSRLRITPKGLGRLDWITQQFVDLGYIFPDGKPRMRPKVA